MKGQFLGSSYIKSHVEKFILFVYTEIYSIYTAIHPYTYAVPYQHTATSNFRGWHFVAPVVNKFLFRVLFMFASCNLSVSFCKYWFSSWLIPYHHLISHWNFHRSLCQVRSDYLSVFQFKVIIYEKLILHGVIFWEQPLCLLLLVVCHFFCHLTNAVFQLLTVCFLTCTHHSSLCGPILHYTQSKPKLRELCCSQVTL